MMIRCTDFTKVRKPNTSTCCSDPTRFGAITHLVALRKHGDVERTDGRLMVIVVGVHTAAIRRC